MVPFTCSFTQSCVLFFWHPLAGKTTLAVCYTDAHLKEFQEGELTDQDRGMLGSWQMLGNLSEHTRSVLCHAFTTPDGLITLCSRFIEMNPRFQALALLDRGLEQYVQRQSHMAYY